MLGFGHVTSDAAAAPDLVLGEFSVNDDFWGLMDMQQSCSSSSSSSSSSSHRCIMLDTLFTESLIRNFRLLGSAVAYIRFGYSFINNDAGEFVSLFKHRPSLPVEMRGVQRLITFAAGEIHAPVLKHYRSQIFQLQLKIVTIGKQYSFVESQDRSSSRQFAMNL